MSAFRLGIEHSGAEIRYDKLSNSVNLINANIKFERYQRQLLEKRRINREEEKEREEQDQEDIGTQLENEKAARWENY